MFHLRTVWESSKFSNEEFSPDAFCSFVYDQQCCLVTGSFSGLLRIFFPSKSGEASAHTEINLKSPIIQIEHGNFIKGAGFSLAVLFEKRLVLYDLKQVESAMVVNELQSFTLSHPPYNFIATHLESANKPMQLIVQSTDGFLTVLSASGQESYKIPHFFLPQPFCYIPILESFIFASADFKVSSYRKNIIMNNNGNGEPVEEWSFIFGEQVVSLHYWQAKTKFVTASNFEIAIVGERMLAVVNESGRIKSFAKHNGNAVASHAYSAVNDKNKNCNNLLISSFDKTICVYLNFQKVWQLTLDQPAIAVSIVDIKPTQGLLALMGIDGQITVGYLGTHDSKGLGLPKLPHISKKQLKKYIEKAAQRIDKAPNQNPLQIFVNVSRASPKHVEIILQSNSKEVLSDVNCFVDTPPTINPVPPFSIESLKKDEVTFQLEFEPTDAPPAQQTIKINATFMTPEKKMLSKIVEFDIPYEFFVKRVETRLKGKNKIILHSNGGFATLNELFPNLVLKSNHEMSLTLTNGEVISISIDSKNKRYRLEADEYSELGLGISIISNSLMKVSKGTLSSKDKISLTPLLTVAKNHYNLRAQERELQKTIHANVGELESVQKALIVRYEAATPEPIDDLNELFVKVTDVLKDTTKRLFEIQAQIKILSAQIEAHMYTLINLINVVHNPDEKTMRTLRSYLPLSVEHCTPGWEECVVVCIPAFIKKMTNGKAGHNFGSTPEFLSNFDVLVDCFDNLLKYFTSKTNSK